jgi:hypothetical protein
LRWLRVSALAHFGTLAGVTDPLEIASRAPWSWTLLYGVLRRVILRPVLRLPCHAFMREEARPERTPLSYSWFDSQDGVAPAPP